MKGCLNIFWHIPLFGFVFALLYAIAGLLLCCTVFLIPVGLGVFQIAKYLLSPFSSSLVSRSDLELIKPQGERNSALGAYIVLLKILYIPFGILGAAFAVFGIVEDIISIFGIPCAVVWFRALPAIFNPVDKICVPKEVADEIERIKGGNIVDKYKGTAPAPQSPTSPAAAPTAAPTVSAAPAVAKGPEVRNYDEAKLNNILGNASMYRAELVEQCRRELEIRRNSRTFMAEVSEFDDAKIAAILADPQLYSDELIYCCELTAKERQAARERVAAAEAEARRIEAAKAAEEQRLRRAEQWRKQRPYVFAALAVLGVVLASFIAWRYVQYKKAMELEERQRMEMFMERQREQMEAEKRAEEERAAAEKRAEEQRKAAAKRAEEQRIAAAEAERVAAEEAKLDNDIEYRHSKGIYRVGDYNKSINGVVFSLSDGGRHGKAITMQQFSTLTWEQAKSEFGQLPTVDDMDQIRKNISVLNATLAAHNGTLLTDNQYYWTSSAGAETGKMKKCMLNKTGAIKADDERTTWRYNGRGVLSF